LLIETGSMERVPDLSPSFVCAGNQLVLNVLKMWRLLSEPDNQDNIARSPRTIAMPEDSADASFNAPRRCEMFDEHAWDRAVRNACHIALAGSAPHRDSRKSFVD
jgi:hypothetical protein